METFATSLGLHLRPGLDTAHAAAILQVYCLPEVYDVLVRQSGWAADDYQVWLLRNLKRELMGDKFIF
jgi:hypothetical protein